MKGTLVIVAVALIGVVGCGGDDDPAARPGDQAAAPSSSDGQGSAGSGSGTGGSGSGSEDRQRERRPGTTIEVVDSQFGEILFQDERAIYLFDKEEGSRSECYGACAEAWPPVLTEGKPQAGRGIEADLLGTTKREDGTVQVTYNDHPLYFYVDDPPGQALCHNVEEFGGLWLVVEPGGDAVQ